ncbi:MAG TPA: glycosyltransferase [Methylomirabilota bacterium]|nr:glycosyltransferase [Methylomirabilota bacterium]
MTSRPAGSCGPGAAPPGRVDVCHVITRLIVGGAQENTVLTCAGLTRTGHRSVLVTGPETGPEGDLRGEAEQRGVPVCVIPSLVRELAPRRDLAALLALRRLFERSRPDIVHTHSSKAGILGRLAARWARVPVIVHTVHGWGFHGSTPPVRRAAYVGLERLVARWTTRLVVVSERDRTTGLGDRIGTPGQYTLIRSGVDLAPFRDARQHRAAVRASLGVPPAAPVIGAVTRLAAQKDPTTLVRAAGAVLRDLGEAHLVVVGDGPSAASASGSSRRSASRRAFAWPESAGTWPLSWAPSTCSRSPRSGRACRG